MRNQLSKIIFVSVGLLLILFGSYLTLGIFVYSMKERDNEGYYFLIVSVGLLITGITVLAKGVRKKT
jgi:hypothetical protein